MLAAQGIVHREDAAAIGEGLDRIAAEYGREGDPEDPALADIHMHVEHRLADLIGQAAGRLHTARSRNYQVATAFRSEYRRVGKEWVSTCKSRATPSNKQKK